MSEDQLKIRALANIIQHEAAGGVGSLDERALVRLPRLYRFASSQLARLETAGVDELQQKKLRVLLTRAHSILYRPKRHAAPAWIVRIFRFLMEESPRAIRQEWKLVLTITLLFYGLSLGSYFLVREDLGIAYSLLDPAAVNSEIQQIEETPLDEPFVGNFSFGTDKSSMTAGWILAHNMKVSVIFFGSGLCPPLYAYVLGNNALMLGTYTGVASHWGRADEISSILWCHGVLEIQAIILAGIAGLLMIRAWIAPGPWTRGYAMKLESKQAWRLMAPVFPILFTAGLIEGFVSPHAPYEVRMATAVVTGCLMLAWILFGGRRTAKS